MNQIATDCIKKAKEMMINFGPIKLQYDQEPSGFQCLRPLDVYDLQARL